MKSYNKGFTYVELIIAIAIMSIIVGFSTITLGTVNRNNVNRSADRIASSINEGRNKCLTSGSKNGCCNFYMYDGVLYCYFGENIYSPSMINFSTQDWKKVSAKPLTFMFGTNELTEGNCVSLSFKQSTGEFLGYNGSLYEHPEVLNTGTLIVKTQYNDRVADIEVNEFGKVTY